MTRRPLRLKVALSRRKATTNPDTLAQEITAWLLGQRPTPPLMHVDLRRTTQS